MTCRIKILNEIEAEVSELDGSIECIRQLLKSVTPSFKELGEAAEVVRQEVQTLSIVWLDAFYEETSEE